MTAKATHRQQTNGGASHTASASHTATPNPENYKTIPALAAYIDRIASELGATVDQRNFKRITFQTDEGKYKKDKVTITIVDGVVKSPKGLEPTEEEAAAIKAAYVGLHIPKSRGAPNILKLKVSRDQLYEFWDRERKHILHVQQRVDKDDGSKYYLPWTFFSDGKWYQLEPDGELPLWKPSKKRNKCQIMIHEGAKAAALIDSLVNDPSRRKELAAHPWGEALKEYEHWGWIGGAPNPDRTDWSEVLAENPEEIVIVADNDQAGIDAIPKISSALLRTLKVVTFKDHGFPPRFDLGEPKWPRTKQWWEKEGQRYIGPSLEDCLKSATWATDKIPPEGKGPPSYRIRPAFAAEWHVVTGLAEPLYIHRDQTFRKLSEKAFNVAVKPFSHVESPARYLKSSFYSQCDGITYNPGRPPGIITAPGEGSQVNTYRPPSIKEVSGDATPFLDFMEHLIPNEDDRREVLRWVATFIDRPDIRMLYALLLISETQGVGKSTLGYILALLAGLWNVSFPNEGQIVDADYNSWQAHKRLAVVNEIYAGHNLKAYTKLKDKITDPHVDVSEKYIPEYTINNWIHIVACSNSMGALRVDDDDRRWLIPKVTEKLQPSSYWKEFYDWLRVDGLSIIKWWANDFLKTNAPVEQGEHAPDTSMKKQVIAEGRSEGEKIAFDLGVHIAGLPDKIVIDLLDVRNLVLDRRGDRKADPKTLDRPARLHKMLVNGGLHQAYCDKNGELHRFMVEDKKTRIVANFPIPEGAEWHELKQYHRHLKDLVPDWYSAGMFG